ncbi:hypothetical protein GDO81_026836 [Engystomops pustulosus]|uniref:Uncharacterized protein n=1 Tax=Engystomops pustulosus TaxID=76066 RepID=A0AAV6YR17_ENGPU|nr:hypothetical protein GDO81_026836 [Engystomops pustulosus]
MFCFKSGGWGSGHSSQAYTPPHSTSSHNSASLYHWSHSKPCLLAPCPALVLSSFPLFLPIMMLAGLICCHDVKVCNSDVHAHA